MTPPITVYRALTGGGAEGAGKVFD
jgi:hypothetical protein